jgi:Secretion system C-terminal sorting domain
MKQLFTFFIALLTFISMAEAQTPTQKIVGDSTGVAGQYIYRNRTLGTDKIHLLEDLVYVQSGATLTIAPGALIKGSGKGTIIVTRGGKLIADGKKNQPIVFTSSKAVGARAQGDWGGIILLGKAANNGSFNNVFGEMQIEGGVQDAYGNAIHGGGANPVATDNSGTLRYVRIEFGGFQFSQNNEINGLTMGSVGTGTILENIQCSFINDDSYEWFGGSVNAKNLISFASVDDDFDTDNGYNGNVQFGFVLRDGKLFDGSGDSNGFESDNNAGGTYIPPYTAPNFSNITVVGPRVSSTTTVSSFFNHAARVRRLSRNGIYNSILMGFRNSGYRLESTGAAKIATADSTALVLNTIIPRDGNGSIASLDSAANANLSGGILPYLLTVARANDTSKTVAELMLNDPFNLLNPNPTPKAGSPALTGAAFTDTRLASTFFDKTVTFRGAFGTTNWMDGWSNFRPDTMKYDAPLLSALSDLAEAGFKAKVYPNPAKNFATVELSLDKAMTLDVQVLDILGRSVSSVKGKRFTEGVNQLPLDFTGVAKGMYFVRFISNADNAQKTLTLTITE